MEKTLRLMLAGIVTLIAPAADPGLFFREDWKEIPPATPVTQEHVANPDLIVTRHGPGQGQLRVILKLESGAWLVSDQHDDESGDWRVREFTVSDLRWRALDIATLVEGRRAESPDLSRVAEVGFSDLMRGGRTQACSRLDWIEVYGRGVALKEAGR
jgi:hypothetical protein